MEYETRVTTHTGVHLLSSHHTPKLRSEPSVSHWLQPGLLKSYIQCENVQEENTRAPESEDLHFNWILQTKNATVQTLK